MKTKSVMRICALVALCLIAYAGLLSTPHDDSTTWMADFILVKCIGFAAAVALCKLYTRWSKTDKWIAAFDRRIERGI